MKTLFWIGILSKPGICSPLQLQKTYNTCLRFGLPPNIFGIGLNYRAHAEETGAAIPTEPFIFQKVTTSILGPGQPIRLPEQAPFEVDYEAELAIIIRKPASCISKEQANEYILGYTCVNDVSARDCQFKRDSQWTRAKGFDTFCPIGPAIVSPQEFNATNADIFLEVNGQTMQSGNTSDMVFSPAELVSYLSHQFTLMPWTVICTGTPPGVGIGRKPSCLPPRWGHGQNYDSWNWIVRESCNRSGAGSELTDTSATRISPLRGCTTCKWASMQGPRTNPISPFTIDVKRSRNRY